MNLELAMVIDCSASGCRVRYLEGAEPVEAAFGARVQGRIRIRRDQLVVVDRDAAPPQIVWRLFHGKVHAIDGERVTVSRLDGNVEHAGENGLLLEAVAPAADLAARPAVGDVVYYEHGPSAGAAGVLHDVAEHGRPAHPEALRARLFPKIVETYASFGAA